MKPLQLAWFIFTAAVAAWVLSTCVTQAQVKGFMILPPIEYDHDYEGDLTIKMVDSVEELRVLCDNNTPQMLACSMNNARSCLIIMVKDEVMRQRGWTTGLLLRHERGHCNGWAAARQVAESNDLSRTTMMREKPTHKECRQCGEWFELPPYAPPKRRFCSVS